MSFMYDVLTSYTIAQFGVMIEFPMDDHGKVQSSTPSSAFQ